VKILVTGNMGYVGPWVVERLRRSYPSAVLIGYDTGYFADRLTNTMVLPECLVDVQYFSDVRNFPEEVLTGVDAVIHLAAISNDPMGSRYEDVTFAVNHRASVELARKARRAGVRNFVYASSCSTYGYGGDEARMEDSSLNPLTAYAKSKVATEQGLQEIAGEGFIVTCLRFSTACGMSSRLRLDLVLNDFVASAVAAGKITILSDGTPWRPLINVKDMARAVDWAAFRDAENGGGYLVVNVGTNGWNYQVKDLAECVARVIPGVEVEINSNAQPDKRSYRVNFDRFKSLAPDHQPEYDLQTTILELKSGLDAMGFREKNFRETNFMRLRVLDSLRERGLLDEDLRWAGQPPIIL
jgi:nucleoside-diphosphate-sugar epimerase